MSALRQPDFDRYYSPETSFTALQTPSQNRSKPTTATKSKNAVKQGSFPQQNRLPQNLKLLSALQKTSFGLAIGSMLASTALYISTVQIPGQWSQEYRNLEDLQRQERQLIAINEKIKYQIAREAGSDRNLTISQPESAIFITPAKVNSKAYLKTPSNDREIVKIKYDNLGY